MRMVTALLLFPRGRHGTSPSDRRTFGVRAVSKDFYRRQQRQQRLLEHESYRETSPSSLSLLRFAPGRIIRKMPFFRIGSWKLISNPIGISNSFM